MSKVVDHLAELTGFRDRDVLDTTLAGALRDLLQPQRVAIHRCVGEENDRRWLTRARLEAAEAAASADPLWVEFDSLPPMSNFPARVAAIERHEMVSVPGSPHITVFPLFTDRDVAGVVEVESADSLDAEQQRLVASILRIYRNFQSLLDYSERDTLTGLLNRKTFDEAFYKLSGQTVEGTTTTSGERRIKGAPQSHYIGVLDIDHFKSVNDRFGHETGDRVLVAFAEVARGAVRSGDLVARLGGEEFGLILPDADQVQAEAVCERLRAMMGRAELTTATGTVRVTASIGLAPVTAGATRVELLRAADEALYRAKAQGRNRLALAA